MSNIPHLYDWLGQEKKDAKAKDAAKEEKITAEKVKEMKDVSNPSLIRPKLKIMQKCFLKESFEDLGDFYGFPS